MTARTDTERLDWYFGGQDDFYLYYGFTSERVRVWLMEHETTGETHEFDDPRAAIDSAMDDRELWRTQYDPTVRLGKTEETT